MPFGLPFSSKKPSQGAKGSSFGNSGFSQLPRDSASTYSFDAKEELKQQASKKAPSKPLPDDEWVKPAINFPPSRA
ncbi:hypothetical protein NKR23_g12030 [Pleurostoma richardsiae]|uniref:Uncharacterized protein n=1 Tax=Pleurostoma richardsiae TaxID=41990 RepID=A0AA38R230_9PEZI|nr:hypothetical protein NKR23_g12030 [Pleurostoma richardsiae]